MSLHTKAEFDSLKNNFQNQIDQYNSSIDSKIDGAIASYLAGIKTTNSSLLTLPLASWGAVTCMNFLPTETFQPFSFDISYQVSGTATTTTNWSQVVTGNAAAKWDRPTSSKMKVRMCYAGDEQANWPDYITWRGLSVNYKEKVIATRIANHEYSSVSDQTTSQWINGFQFSTFYFINWTNFKPVTGSTNINQYASSAWVPSFYNVNTRTGSASWGESSIMRATFSTDVQLEKSAGKDMTYEHVIHNTSLSSNYCDPTWINHFYNNGGVTGTTLNSTAGTSIWSQKNWAGVERNNGGTGSTGKGSTTVTAYAGAYNSNTNSAIMPTIGRSNKSYSSSYVKQISDPVTQRIGNEVFTQDNITLMQGFCCFAAKKNDKIVWEPEFKSVTGNQQVNVWLCNKPFGSGVTLPTGGQWLKNAGQTDDYMTTTSLKCKYEFIMPNDGFVWCKWQPVSTSGNWEATLDLTKCNTYTRTVED